MYSNQFWKEAVNSNFRAKGEVIMSQKTKVILTILCLGIAFMDISGLPGVLLKVNLADIGPYIIPLMINFILIGILEIVVLKLFKVTYDFGFSVSELRDVKGLFLNIVEAFADKKDNKIEIAIIVSSVVFGLGHIPGMLGMGIGVIIFKVISTIGMGFYFGTIYKKTGNLWVPIIMHSFIDICALPYCFTQNMRYETVSLIILVITYLSLSFYCINLWFNRKVKHN